MVKKIEPDWTTYIIQPNTASSTRKYLDLCQNWLIEPQDKTDIKHQFCNKKIEFSSTIGTHIGMYESEVNNITQFSCTICKKESNMEQDGKTMISNPFTRAQCMLLCNDCYTNIMSFR